MSKQFRAGIAGGLDVDADADRGRALGELVLGDQSAGLAVDLDAAVGYSLTNGGDTALETDRFELDGRAAVWAATRSYTHLTLPPTELARISGGARVLQQNSKNIEHKKYTLYV